MCANRVLVLLRCTRPAQVRLTVRWTLDLSLGRFVKRVGTCLIVRLTVLTRSGLWLSVIGPVWASSLSRKVPEVLVCVVVVAVICVRRVVIVSFMVSVVMVVSVVVIVTWPCCMKSCV